MPLLPQLLLQSQSLDATQAVLSDATGNYSIGNPGGYGAPNELVSSIAGALLQIILPNIPLMYPVVSTNYNGIVLPPGPVPSSLPSISITLSGPTAQGVASGTNTLAVNMGLLGFTSRLPNGVYTYIYTLTFVDGTVVPATGTFFLIGQARVCQYAKIGAFALTDPGCSCDQDENTTSLALLGLVIQAAVNAYACGDYTGAQKMSEWLDVRCNTLNPGSQVINYGQSSSGTQGCGCL